MRELQIVDDYDNKVYCFYDVDENIDPADIQNAIRKFRLQDLTYDDIMDKVEEKFGGHWYFPNWSDKITLYI